MLVDVRATKKTRLITLPELRAHPGAGNMVILQPRQSAVDHARHGRRSGSHYGRRSGASKRTGAEWNRVHRVRWCCSAPHRLCRGAARHRRRHADGAVPDAAVHLAGLSGRAHRPHGDRDVAGDDPLHLGVVDARTRPARRGAVAGRRAARARHSAGIADRRADRRAAADVLAVDHLRGLRQLLHVQMLRDRKPRPTRELPRGAGMFGVGARSDSSPAWWAPAAASFRCRS